MASEQGSGSGSGQDIKHPVYGPREESNSAATATAAAEPPPPPRAPPVEVLQGRVHERPGDGGGSPSPAAAAEAEVAAPAADRKGKKVAAASSSSSSSPSSSAGSSSPLTSPVVSISGGEESSVAEEVNSGRKVRVSWKEQVVEEVVAVPKVVRPIDLKNAFGDMRQEAETKQENGQVKPPTQWPKKRNSVGSKVEGGLNNMVLKRIRRQRCHSNRNSTSMITHVNKMVLEAIRRAMCQSHRNSIFTWLHVDPQVLSSFARRLYSSRRGYSILAVILVCSAYFPTTADGFIMHESVEKAANALQTLPNIMVLRNQLEDELAAAPRPRAGSAVGGLLLFLAGAFCLTWLFSLGGGQQVPAGEQPMAPDFVRPPPPPQATEVDFRIAVVVLVLAVITMLVAVSFARRS